MKSRFTGKAVIVTGAGSGIGRAAALLFSREGGRVAVVDRDAAEAEATMAAIRDAAGEAIAITADVSQGSNCAAMVERTMVAFGRLDIAFNNAGIGSTGFNIPEEEEEIWDRIAAVNLKGVFLSMKHEIPAMRRGGGGVIVNTASVAGLVGEKGIATYSATKHGVVGMTRTAALDHIGENIRINAICPGGTLTPMVARSLQRPGVAEQRMSRHPIGRFAKPEEIARAALFLASEDASFIVGHALAVDGGLTAQ
ncbi:glucose 1-dehydrogenase [Roseomonas chloroacetimidivorans]|uniref:glucose 1-dehydrogenase n=1 Tax=Roseomonas chloroacetimidivorans TaxID=1766656 RepID=UPI003C75F996